MTSGSTCVLVETGDEDPIMSVVGLVAGLTGDAGLPKECTKLLEAGKFTDVVSKIMQSQAKVFGSAPEKDVEASVLIIAGLAQRLAPADGAKCVEQLVAAALSGTDRAMLRATVLFQLYNMVTAAPERLAILNKTLAFVRKAKIAELVPFLARHVEDNYMGWGLDAAATRTMLHDIFSMLSDTSGSADPNDAAAKRVLDLQLKYLATFQPGEALSAEAEEVAKAAVVSFIHSTDMMFRCDLLSYSAVQALKQTKSAPTLQLLTTLLTGASMADFTTFAAANAALFKALGLDEAECAQKMRLLALCALAEASTAAAPAETAGEVTYGQVAAALQCGADEVEGWIVRAIGARLVEAKMDQQWRDLRASIECWRDNMAGVREAVAKSAEARGKESAPIAAH